MAISIATGVFTKPAATTTGPFSPVTTLTFLPKALYLWSVGRIANATFETTRNFSQGVATAAGAQGCYGSNGLEGGSTGVTGCSSYQSGSEILAFTHNDIFGPTVGTRIAFVSFDTLGGGLFGFTLNMVLNAAGFTPSGAARIHYLAIGGDSITHATVKNWASGEVIGSYPITGVGFQPDFMLGIGGPQGPDGFGNGATGSLMVANCQLEQWCVTNVDSPFSAEPAFPVISLRQQRTDVCSITRGFAGGVEGYARLTSMDADGWTTAVDATAGASAEWFTICLKGIGSKISSVAKRSGTGPQTIAVAPMGTPVAVLLASHQHVAGTAVQDIARIGVGAYDGTNQGAVAAISPTTGLTGYGGIDDSSAAFVKIDNTAGTVDARATGLSLTPSGVTLNWTVGDSVATELLYCAFDDSTIGTCGQTFPSAPPVTAISQDCVPLILCPEQEEP